MVRSTMDAYSTRDVAKMVGLSFARVRLLISQNDDCPRPSTRVGNAYVWTDRDIKRLKKWLDARPERRGRPRKDADDGGQIVGQGSE